MSCPHTTMHWNYLPQWWRLNWPFTLRATALLQATPQHRAQNINGRTYELLFSSPHRGNCKKVLTHRSKVIMPGVAGPFSLFTLWPTKKQRAQPPASTSQVTGFQVYVSLFPQLLKDGNPKLGVPGKHNTFHKMEWCWDSNSKHSVTSRSSATKGEARVQTHNPVGGCDGGSRSIGYIPYLQICPSVTASWLTLNLETCHLLTPT